MIDSLNSREESMYRRLGYYLSLAGICISIVVGLISNGIWGYGDTESLILCAGLVILVLSMGVSASALIPPFREVPTIGLEYGKKTMYDYNVPRDVKQWICEDKRKVFIDSQRIVDEICMYATFSLILLITGISLIVLMVVDAATNLDISFLILSFVILVTFIVAVILKRSLER